MNRLFQNHRGGLTQFALLSAAVVFCATALWPVQPSLFQRFFGSTNPVLALLILASAGGLALNRLASEGWLRITSRRDSRFVPRLAFWSLPFAIAAIAIDLTVGFPQDLNASLPNAFLFYPVMAFTVEVALHLLPIALLIFLFGRSIGPNARSRFLWIIFVPVALIEPVLQFNWALNDNRLNAIAMFSAIQVFVFTLVELYTFKRWGFIAMYLFRIYYYFYWHIAWGWIRLQF